MSVSINGTNGLTFSDSSTQNTAASGFGFKNRIINGDMRIDQRNAGASVTPTNGQYSVDRWLCLLSQSSKYTIQQNANSVTPPAGFNNYLGVVSSSAYSVLTGDYFAVSQRIEGLNFSDLGWGSANAQDVTVSFWARSSLTGTFGGALRNSANDRSYPFTYTISAANTWEYKSVTIQGDTSGTWLATSGIGLQLLFGLGVGSTFSASAGAWASGNYVSATGATSVVGTSGATFYITGVQLEKGSTATSFDYRDYGRELAMCQRYLPCFGTGAGSVGAGYCTSTVGALAHFAFLVSSRVKPTGITVSSASHFQVRQANGAGVSITTIAYDSSSTTGAQVYASGATGLVAGQGTMLQGSDANALILFNGCEL